jgi:UV DNA damage endonuclease
MIRLGLCCIFRDERIKFRNTTAAAVSRLARCDGLAKLSRLCLSNAEALRAALGFCSARGIGCFRVNSQILPLKTHPELGYSLEDLPDGDEVRRRFLNCGEFARAAGLRTSFHPDQFVVLNSTRPDVVVASVRELEYQAEVASWIGADVVNIHAGGAYGDKASALAAFARNLGRLSDLARSKLTIENDDSVYTPSDLLPLCRAEGVPLVYDVHHHRCLPDGLNDEDATAAAVATWTPAREPMFHLSSPLHGWDGPKPARHHDFIDPEDFPDEWLRLARKLDLTVEVEAKAKEAAVFRLREDLAARPRSR